MEGGKKPVYSNNNSPMSDKLIYIFKLFLLYCKYFQKTQDTLTALPYNVIIVQTCSRTVCCSACCALTMLPLSHFQSRQLKVIFSCFKIVLSVFCQLCFCHEHKLAPLIDNLAEDQVRGQNLSISFVLFQATTGIHPSDH